jgi:hypothetical protein
MGNIKAQEPEGKKKKGPKWRRYLLCPVCFPLCMTCCLVCTPCLLRKRSKIKKAMKEARAQMEEEQANGGAKQSV